MTKNSFLAEATFKRGYIGSRQENSLKGLQKKPLYLSASVIQIDLKIKHHWKPLQRHIHNPVKHSRWRK